MKFSTAFGASAVYTLSTLVSSVAAHGYVDQVIVGGTTYEGFKPFDDPYRQPAPDRVIRKIPNDGPVTDWNSDAIICNTNAPTTAGLVAEANPGDPIEFIWKWVPGHKGPVTDFLAKCPGKTCDGFSGSGKVWFKIAEQGLITPPGQSGDGGYWASDKLMDAGGKWDIKLPDDLEPGAYLLRHEILAMHSAGNPQFYPACMELRVGGSGTKTASESEKVAISQMYEDDKASVLFNIYKEYNSYKIAGPPVAALAASGGAPPPPADPTSDPTSDPTETPTASRTRTRTGTRTAAGTTTVTSTVRAGAGTTTRKAASAPTGSSAQACKASKKRSTSPQSNPPRDRSKRHVSDRKRRLSYGHDH